MKLVVVTAKQSTSVNLNDLENRIHINPKGLLGICDCEKNENANTLGKQIISLVGIRRKLLIRKAG